MPVKFTAFFAKKSGQYIQLSWTTSEEMNNSHFEIQRSNDGRSWNMIGQVVAGSASVNNYTFTDRNNANGATVYYRLKQIDKDGAFLYSTIKAVHANNASSIATIYAATPQTIAVEFNQQLNGKIIVRIVSVTGQSVFEKVFSEPAYRVVLNVPAANKGMYIVQIIGEGKIAESKKVVL
jgi:hypothetical protein